MADDPCEPNPCGPHSNPPRNVGGRCDCSCLPGVQGSPPNCRPECVINDDCPTDKACQNQRCQDPCPGTCGINANCRVRNHLPICACNKNYVGDPFSNCNEITSKCANFFPFIILNKKKFSFKNVTVPVPWSKVSYLKLVEILTNIFRSHTQASGSYPTLQPIPVRHQRRMHWAQSCRVLQVYPRLSGQPLCGVQARMCEQRRMSQQPGLCEPALCRPLSRGVRCLCHLPSHQPRGQLQMWSRLYRKCLHFLPEGHNT